LLDEFSINNPDINFTLISATKYTLLAVLVPIIAKALEVGNF
jgi:hypothetical protein